MPTLIISTPTKNPPIPIVTVKNPEAAELTASGHWSETQVIESIKEANLRRRDPRQTLNGLTTQRIGAIFHPVIGEEGRLITPKLRKRTRLKRILSFFKA